MIVVGCNHRNADLELLERLAVPADDHRKELNGLIALEHVLEASLLSTCNRVEVYVHVSRFHPGLDEVMEWMTQRAGDLADAFIEQRYVHFDESAATHLFRVASGLDSMVVGEQQIALQVKQAMEEARDESAARGMLLRLFRHAVHTGRKVRRETTIARGASSIVDVGLEAVEAVEGIAERAAGDRSALIIGAGKIGGLSADRLAARGLDLTVWNRSADKARRLADRVGASVAEDLAAALETVDVAVCTTGAATPLITREMVEQAVGASSRPLVLLDLAMPHNVEADCGAVDGVTVLGLADIRDRAHRDDIAAAVTEAEALVEGEAQKFSAWMSSIEVEPTIRSLRDRAERVRRDEFERLRSRLAGLDEAQVADVEALTRGILNTLLHTPTVRLKELADAGGADVAAEVLRELFELDADADED